MLFRSDLVEKIKRSLLKLNFIMKTISTIHVELITNCNLRNNKQKNRIIIIYHPINHTSAYRAVKIIDLYYGPRKIMMYVTYTTK